jgi:hypothetical protein
MSFTLSFISGMKINLFVYVFVLVWLMKPLSQAPESNKRMDNPSIRKGLDAISSSLNQLGDTFEKAYEVTHSFYILYTFL